MAALNGARSTTTEFSQRIDAQLQSMPVRILVLDANQRSALAVTRSLGSLPDTHVVTADETPEALAGNSRFSRLYAQHPSPAKAPRQFLHWLGSFVKAQDIDWVFPTTEICSQLILTEPHALGEARIPFAPLGTVMALADKWALVQLAQQLDVPHPASSHYSDAAELIDQALATLTYPLVIKPTQSRRWLGDRWLTTSVHVAHDEAELRNLLREKEYLRDYPFMLQEFIDGHGAGVFALYDSGKPVTFFAHQRLREKPPRGGVSVLSQSAPLHPGALAYTRALLDHVGWHGVAMIEFRISADGTPYLMEVNTRFWGSLQLAIDSGIDFPALLLQICRGNAVSALPDYRLDQRLRWLLGDVDNLYLTLRDGGFSGRDKMRRIIDFLTPHPFNTRHEVNRLGDIKPAIHELRQYLRNLLG